MIFSFFSTAWRKYFLGCFSFLISSVYFFELINLCAGYKNVFHCKNDVFKLKADYDKKHWFGMSSFQFLPCSRKRYGPYLGQMWTDFRFVFLPELVMKFKTINVFAKVRLPNVNFENTSVFGHISKLRCENEAQSNFCKYIICLKRHNELRRKNETKIRLHLAEIWSVSFSRTL